MVELEIDGKKIKVESGTSIIEAADNVGIYIPRFCYHNKLSIAANCRMCLVEVEKSPKPLPACATPVTADMKVFTQSSKALDAQRDVMEYLLINHPLDCPICDQGGECELQDLAMGFGRAYSYYDEPKRSVYDDDLGPLIETEMTRCIHCTRCVRFGEEIAGIRELGVTYRGEKEFISTYIKHFMQSELSGNIIDLCPVGALTAKPSRYTVRGWEVIEHPSIAPHDCVGSNIFVHSRYQEYAPQKEIMRVVPRLNDAINENWISDRDRFSYEALYHKDRVEKPLIKIEDQWQETDWGTALTEVVAQIKKIIRNEGADQIAAIASPNSTLEEFFILQKLMRQLGSHHIDHRFREQDFSDQALMPIFPDLGTKIHELENLDTILLVGTDVRYEQPLLSHRFNKAFQENAKIYAINPIDYDLIFELTDKIIDRDLIEPLAKIAKVLAGNDKSLSALSDITPDEKAKRIASSLKKSKKAGIFIGHYGYQHPNASQIRALVHLIGKLSDTSVGVFTEGANASGAWLAGMIPHRGPAGQALETVGYDAKSLFTDKSVKGYLLFNVEPEYDTAYPASAINALNNAEFVVSFSTYTTKAMKSYANVILPLAPFTETDGTYVNIQGDWQSFKAASIPEKASKPGWKIIALLAKIMKFEGFNYQSAFEIRKELEKQIKENAHSQRQEESLSAIEKNKETFLRVAPWHMYRNDSLVRRAKPLQKYISEKNKCVQLNQAMADQLKLVDGMKVIVKQKNQEITLPLLINNALSDGILLIPSGLKETAGFGENMAPVDITRAQT